jgi:hypothetical protein
VPTQLRPLLTSLSIPLKNSLHLLRSKQPLIASLSIRQLLTHEQLTISALPHPGFVMDLLTEAKRHLPKDVTRGRLVLEEVVEYLDVLLWELRTITDPDLPVILPRSSLEVLQTRLLQRMRLWDDNEDRYRLVGMNPIYRDLVVRWGGHAGKEGRRASTELQSLWW